MNFKERVKIARKELPKQKPMSLYVIREQTKKVLLGLPKKIERIKIKL